MLVRPDLSLKELSLAVFEIAQEGIVYLEQWGLLEELRLWLPFPNLAHLWPGHSPDASASVRFIRTCETGLLTIRVVLATLN
jgi:hypothetical protein